MSKSEVVIVDYGVGNLLSVQRAVEECGARAITTFDGSVIAKADRVILPGVGAFANGMRALNSLGLVQVIKEIAEDGTPLLGICLGMQLLLDESEEHGVNKGLGIISGRVVSISPIGHDEAKVKIPHIGWNSLLVAENASWESTILRNTPSGDSVYFVHSFMAEPEHPEMRIADCSYGGRRISAAIGYENITGCQFHPEKSGSAGLQILKNFLQS